MNYFKPEEFACKCGCGLTAIEPRLLAILNDVRAHFGKPVVVTSGRRCFDYNAEVGGSLKSQHLLGTAADIQIRGVAPSTVQRYINEQYSNALGLGSYRTFTHVDVRPKKARWRG